MAWLIALTLFRPVSNLIVFKGTMIAAITEQGRELSGQLRVLKVVTDNII